MSGMAKVNENVYFVNSSNPHSWLQRRQHWRWPEVARNGCSTEVLQQRKRNRQWWLPINRKEGGISRRGCERSRKGGGRAWPGSRCSPQEFRDVAKQVKLLIIITKIVMLVSLYKFLLDLKLFPQGRWLTQANWLEWRARCVSYSFNWLNGSTPTWFTTQSKFFCAF